jgi:DNA-binding NarL/FixJ family response regulator
VPDTDLIRVFLVDDHEMWREGVRAKIQDGVDVVGEADEVDFAVELIRERQPEVVLVDVRIDFGGGARVIREVHRTHPDIKFLALTAYDSAEDVVTIIRAGARGYLTKDVHGDELVDMIRLVNDGGAVVSPQLAAFAISAFDGESTVPLDPELDILTPTEIAVATLVAKGYTNRQIAAERESSPKTVEKHVSAILEKLSLTNRTQVTRWVLEHQATGGPSSPA